MQRNGFLFLSFLLFFLLIVNAFNATSFYAPDEYYQIIEFAAYKLGIVSSQNLAWEFHELSRQAIQPFIVYYMFKALGTISIVEPSTQIYFLRVFTSILFVLALNYYVKKTSSLIPIKLQKWYIVSSFLFWAGSCYYFRFSQEILTQIIYLVIAAMVIDQKSIRHFFFKIGLLAGFAFIIRYQSIISLFGIVVWYSVEFLKGNKTNYKQLCSFSASFILVVLLGVLIDYWFYNQWIFMPYRYFYYQIVKGVADGFGTQPFYFYFLQLFLFSTPIFGVILYYSLFKSIKNKNFNLPLLIIISTIVVLSIIGHKEERFLFSIYMFLPYVVFKGLGETIRLKTLKTFLVINVLFIVVSIFFNLQIMSDNEKSLQNYIVHNFKENPFRILYTGSCHPFKDKVKVNIYNDTLFLKHNYLMTQNYADVEINQNDSIKLMANDILYIKKSIYKTLKIGKHQIVRQSIPKFLEKILEKNKELNSLFENSIIYVIKK